MQKHDVSDVMAPSTLGNKAEIIAMIKIIPMLLLNVSLNAIVGKRSSAGTLILCAGHI